MIPRDAVSEATDGAGAGSVSRLMSLSESTVEAVALDWLASLGWAVAHGADVAPDTPGAERTDYGEVVLHGRLRSALARLHPDLPDDALDDARHRLTRKESMLLVSLRDARIPKRVSGEIRLPTTGKMVEAMA